MENVNFSLEALKTLSFKNLNKDLYRTHLQLLSNKVCKF